MPDASETVMAFDFGTRRIGVAVGETLLGRVEEIQAIEKVAHGSVLR